MTNRSMPRARRIEHGHAALVTAAAALALVVGACAIAPSPTASPAPTLRPLDSGEVPVRTVEPAPSGAAQACAGVGFDAVLHGSPGDPARTWIVYPGGGRTDEVIWPAGYSARFTPALEVIDASGRVVARDGTRVLGGCPQPPGGLFVDLPSTP